jgi:tetratricopeptide (TPR) repeat protein
MKNYRYPGSTPFQDTPLDRRIFFGRDYEAELVFHKILGENLLVLFGKSGIGKTSLLNAGIMSQLRENDFVPLYIRFNDPDTDPLKTVCSNQKMKDIIDSKTVDYNKGDERSLWIFFKTAEFWSPDDKLLTPVLILDQFEEFFVHHSPEDRKEFILQLAELTRDKLWRSSKDSLRYLKEKKFQNSGTPDIRIVILIREEFVGLLEEMANDIPGILRNHFRILPLNRNQAEEAIVKPAKLASASEQFDSESFEYEPDALEAILDFLCIRHEQGKWIKTDEVESFQLQVICRYIEDDLIKNNKKQVIKKDDFGGKSGLQKIFKEFYECELKNYETFTRENIIKLCEEGLISIKDRRLSLEQDQIKHNFKVSEKQLDELVNNRLLRSEKRVGSVYYELSHDTLIKPIREYQSKRLNEKQINEKKKLEIGISILSFVFVIIAAFFISYQYKNYKVDSLYNQLQKYTNEWEFSKAEESYKQIIEIDKKDQKAYLELGNSLSLFDNNKAIDIYKKAITNGNETPEIYCGLAKALSKQKHFTEAIQNYNKAIKLNENFIAAYLGIGQVYEEQQDYQKAENIYETALEINKKAITPYQSLVSLYAKRNKFGNAIEIYRNAVQVNTNYAYIYESISSELIKKRRKEELEKIYDIASEVDSEKASYFDSLGKALFDQGKYEKSIKQYKKAIKLDDKYKYSYYNLGVTFEYKEKYDEAIEQFQKVLTIDPNYIYAHNRLGYVFYKQGAYNYAIEQFKKAIKIAPEFKYAYNKMGMALKKQENYEQAIEQFNKALEIDPEYISPKMNFAELYLITGNPGEAFGKASELLKENVSIERRLAMHCVSFVSLLFQKKWKKAQQEFKIFVSCYKMSDNYFQKDWDYDDIKTFINKDKKLHKKKKQIALKLIDVLESSREEGKKKIKELEELM